jgi:hypothetical protein
MVILLRMTKRTSRKMDCNWSWWWQWIDIGFLVSQSIIIAFLVDCSIPSKKIVHVLTTNIKFKVCNHNCFDSFKKKKFLYNGDIKFKVTLKHNVNKLQKKEFNFICHDTCFFNVFVIVTTSWLILLVFIQLIVTYVLFL